MPPAAAATKTRAQKNLMAGISMVPGRLVTTTMYSRRPRPCARLIQGTHIGGFALVAHPVMYGVSWIMTFVVNRDADGERSEDRISCSDREDGGQGDGTLTADGRPRSGAPCIVRARAERRAAGLRRRRRGPAPGAHALAEADRSARHRRRVRAGADEAHGNPGAGHGRLGLRRGDRGAA